MKVLFIAGHEFLDKQDNGGRQCSYRNYTVLQEIFGERNVYLCMLSNCSISDEKKQIRVFATHRNKIQQTWNTFCLRNGYSKRTEKELIRYVDGLDIDLIWYDFSIIGSLNHKLYNRKKCVVFLHNIEKQYMWSKVRHQGIPFILPFFSYAYNEKRIMKEVDKVICLNKRDANELEAVYARKADFLFPMTFSDRYDSSVAENFEIMQERKQTRTFLFVGSLFAPNYDGIVWFIKNVMPYVHDCVLCIVGKGFESKRKELENEHVRVIGTVENLDEYYYRADAVVLPVLYGNGMKVKTAEALMFGKPVFATNEALEGYDVAGVEGIWRCNTAEEFTIAMNAFCKKKSYSFSVREVYLKTYETNIQKVKLQKFLESV